MGLFIPKETLDALSYRSTLGRSLRQISLRATPLKTILEDIAKYRASYIDALVQEDLTGSRFKSNDSILRKCEKTLRNNGGFKQCFNDVLGFRLRFEEYPAEFPGYFRVVDLRNGKRVDDGYQFNLWSHKYVYKYQVPEIGKRLHQEYAEGTLRSEQDFLSRLRELEEG